VVRDSWTLRTNGNGDWRSIMAINITKIVQISKGSRFGDGEWQEDMRKLGNFKTAYDKANDKGMKEVYKNKWYDYVKIVADKIDTYSGKS
tara:strand:- start:1496 stop:1765 length:270 start_codon:yes stop_codon:yes gene_type:complete